MWRCAHCGADIPRGTVCLKCGRPIDETLGKIARKVGGIRLGSDVAERWVWRGAKTGFIVALALAPLLLATVLIGDLITNRNSASLGEALGFTLLSLPVLAIVFPLVFAVVFLVYGGVMKPVWVALFCSIERFEQEYGSMKR